MSIIYLLCVTRYQLSNIYVLYFTIKVGANHREINIQFLSTFGTDSRAVSAVLQVPQRRALLLTVLGIFRLIIALRLFPGLSRLGRLFLLLLLLLLRVGRHCVSHLQFQRGRFFVSFFSGFGGTYAAVPQNDPPPFQRSRCGFSRVT